jgi:hypothetical protein
MRELFDELVVSLIVLLAITALYAWLAQGGIPQASSLVGQGLGIAGLVLMLGAETLYSLRKRNPRVHLGPLRTWLQAHIVFGLVGPYLVLLHSGWKFRGLAGVAMIFMGVVVASGFVGHYIYTAVPRTVDAGTSPAEQSKVRFRGLASARRLLALWLLLHVPLTVVLFTLACIHIGAALYYANLN